jgi:hypothetical protein
MQRVLADADVLQLIAAQLSREQAGRLLAPLCKAGLKVVREADRREDAGLQAGWRRVRGAARACAHSSAARGKRPRAGARAREPRDGAVTALSVKKFCSKNFAVKVSFVFVVWKDTCKLGWPGCSITLQPDIGISL